MFYIPALRDVLTKDGISIGGLGIFVIISYAVGHLVAAMGNFIESLYWRFKGGMPSNWIVGPSPRLLSSSQIAKIQVLTAARLGISVAPFVELAESAWFPIFRQIYSDVGVTSRFAQNRTLSGLG